MNGSPLIAGSTGFTVLSSDSSGRYSGELRVTTSRGVLVTFDRGLLSTDGSFVEVGRVDGTASTGLFAGAEGGIAFSGQQSSPGTFISQVGVAVCLR